MNKTKFANSIEALNKQLNDWVIRDYIPKGCNNIDYIAEHEFFHLLTQDAIDAPNSAVATAVRRAIKDGCEWISINSKYDEHEFVADLLSAKRLTPKQEKLTRILLKLFKGE